MKILYIGGGEWGTFVLKAAVDSGHTVIVVDKIKRSFKLRVQYFVKKILHSFGLFQTIYLAFRKNSFYKTIWQYQLEPILTTSVNSASFIETIKKENIDLILVASLDEILKKNILSIPRFGAINCHPALLPKYRGPNPLPWIIANGELESGVTFHFINEKIDAGDIIFQRRIKLEPNETSSTLLKKISGLVYHATIEVLDLIEHRRYSRQLQDEANGSLYPNPNIEDGHINWNESTSVILRRFRAFKGVVRLFTYFNQRKILVDNITLSTISNGEIYPGRVIKQLTKKNLIISTCDGAVRIGLCYPLQYIQIGSILN